MKLLQVAAAVCVAVAPMSAFAAGAAPVGKVVEASPGVFVARDGKLVAARAGQSLFAGDRVLTRSKGKARVALQGCSTAVAPVSIMAVSDGCAAPKTLEASSAGFSGLRAAQAEGAAASGGGISATAIGIGVVAVAAAAAGIAAGTSGSNATSP